MMGKGKSSVMSPLLTLYLSLIHNKYVYIIVPEHLVADAKLNISQYAHVCGLVNKFIIKSDSEIKKDFLTGNFSTGEFVDGQFLPSGFNNDKVFIIDEFDSLHNYLQSNFNFVINKSTDISKNLYNYIFNYYIPLYILIVYIFLLFRGT